MYDAEREAECMSWDGGLRLASAFKFSFDPLDIVTLGSCKILEVVHFARQRI